MGKPGGGSSGGGGSGGSGGLPSLRGSDKQVAWAQDIRPEKIAEGRAAINEFKANLSAERAARPMIQERIGNAEKGLRWMQSQDHAGWWVSNRSNGIDFTTLRQAGQGMFHNFRSTTSSGTYPETAKGF